jgi:hypothetical protein
MRRCSVAQALGEAARTVHDVPTPDDMLDAIVAAASISVAGFRHAGVSVVHGRDRIESRAVTGRLVWELDEVQYALKEGPCVDSLREVPVLAVEHLRHDQRWPRYVPAAVGHGVLSQLAFRLYADEHTLGCLNFYGTESETLQSGALENAELFAAQATIALGRATAEDGLDVALTSRGDIGRAVGLTMARFGLTSDRALQLLVLASSTSNVGLRDVAHVVIGEADAR